MRILQISTYDISGGAGRAAYRLHRGLRDTGHDCRMLVRYKDTNDDFVSCVAPENQANESDEALYLGVAIQGHYIDSHRTAVSNTLFSLHYPGHDLSTLPLVKEADIINLHWVAQYQSLLTLKRLFDLGKPVVWTLHDQWAFTGGCHYAAGCEKYQADCRACPQLAEDPFHLPEAVLKDKLRLFKNAHLTIVTPSRWMGACAEKSALFKDLRVEVIPNALETDRFMPFPKAKAKKKIGLGPDTVTLLFGGVSGNEKRKGFHKLMGAVRTCLKDPGFRNLVKTKKIRLICFGNASDALEGVGIPVKALGYLDSEKDIVTAYGAADLFVLPSLEDNLPNTMLEAMSCGTPVVAFDLGGIPDGVKNGETGQLVPSGDVRQMGRAILSLISNPEQRKAMGKACRRKAQEQYRLEIQARRYVDLYQELVESCTARVQPATEARVSGLWQVAVPSKERPLSVALESGVEPHFKEIYDPVLFKALKEFSAYAQEQWQASEADRAARLEEIKKLGSQLAASESDRLARDKLIKEISERLKASRLLKDVEKLTADLRESETDRGARLEDINKLSAQLAASESDRVARGELLETSEKDRVKLIELVERKEEIFAGSLFGLLRHRRVAKKRMKTKSRTTPLQRSG